MKDLKADPTGDQGVSSLFQGMSEECVESVASRVLNYLGRASPESKRAFRTELDKLNLRIPGFRNASNAPARLLTTPLQACLLSSDKIASAALKVWAESQHDLCDIVTERITDIGTYISVSAEYPDFSENCLRGHWPKEAWDREKDRFAERYDCFEQGDIALMMCYVTGRLPGIAESKEETDTLSEAVEQLPDILKLLALCAVDLESLPVSAPEWESDIPEFAEKIAETIRAKQEERNRAATLDSFIAEIRNDFSAEIAYLEADVESWSAASLPTSEDIAGALDVCEELRSALAEYRAVRESPPAATKTEDRERRDKNDQLEDLVENLLGVIGRLMSGEPIPDDDPPTRPNRAQNRTEGHGSAQTEPPSDRPHNAAPTSRHPQAFHEFDKEQLARENDSLKSQMDERIRENETLRSENRTLANEVQFQRKDKADIERNVEALQSRLTAKADETDMWRRAYEDESQKPRLTIEDVPKQLNTVGDAVNYAREMFPDRLVLRTNSKSVVQDNPFERPEDVWRALEWLATTYHSAKMGESSVPDFDLSIRQMCGWWYKSDQHETTRNKYRDWYTTRVNGDRRWMLEHIGTGGSKDARHTIRIAFDWDREEKIVVVGYIGQHQRTDAT